jgi:hypothetical protein
MDQFRSGHLPEGFGKRLDERVVEYPWLLSRLTQFGQPLRILDAGSTMNHELILSHPAVKPHKWTILTLGPEANCFWDRGISYLYEDLRCTSFKNECFDVVVSISVIEHVGMNNAPYVDNHTYREHQPDDYLPAIREMRRIIKPGGSLFVTVPFGKYQNYGWLQQFNSEMLSKLIAEFRPRKFNKTFFRYSERGWNFATQEECSSLLFSDATGNMLFPDHKFPKLDPDFAVAARGVACLELEK